MEVPRIVLTKNDNPDVVMALPQRAPQFDAIQGIRPQGPVQQRHVERLLDPQGLGRAAHRRHDLDSRQPLQQGRHHRPQHGIVLHVKKTRIPRHAPIVSPFARPLTRGVHVYPRAGTRVEQWSELPASFLPSPHDLFSEASHVRHHQRGKVTCPASRHANPRGPASRNSR